MSAATTGLARSTPAVVFLLTTLLCAPAASIPRQATPPLSSAAPQQASLSELLEEGERLAVGGKRTEAYELLTRALARARQEKDTRSEARALAALGRNFSAQAKYKEALEHLEPALAIAETLNDPPGIARISNSIAIVHYYLGKKEDSARFYRRAIAAYEAVGNLSGKANALLNLAMLVPRDEANEAEREAASTARELGDKALEARALHQLADGMFAVGDFAAAMHLLERAEALYQDTGELGDLATVYTSMGRLHRAHGLPAEAIPFYEKALALQRKENDKVGIIQSLNAMGVAYGLLNELDQQGAVYEQALALARETGSPRLIQFMQGSLAENLSRRGEYARSATLLEEVLRGGADTQVGARRSLLASVYAQLGRSEEALQQAALAIEWATENKSEEVLLAAMHNRAFAFFRSEKYSEALADLQDCIARVERLRGRLVPADFMKQGFSQVYQNLYSLTIQLYERQGNPGKALEIAALARARAFLDLLATRNLAGTRTALADGLAAEDARSLASYAGGKPLTAAQVAAMAARLHSTILSYWVGGDFVMIWAMKPDGKLHAQRVEVLASRLNQLVRQTQLHVGPPPYGGAKSAAPLLMRGTGQSVVVPAEREAWRDLYDLLIRPVRPHLPARGARLTIIPHGPLQRLSFAALLNEQGRYLLEDFSLHYATAGALLEFTAAQRRESAQTGGYLLVADAEPLPPRRGEKVLPRLPGARQEVRRIAALASAAKVDRLEGESAAEGHVRAAMPGKNVIHLATHGIVRDDAPLDSFLALAKGNDAEDGRLSAEEIYTLDLNAELVVLSACSSGGGAFTGDGIAALARAFLYAGTASLVVTLWDIPDKPSDRVLPDFYRAWLAGRGKGEALREAQLWLLRDLRAGKVRLKTPAGEFALPEHPIFWAGYALLGEPD